MIFKRLLGYRMGENNFFGSGEYYLGMFSGMIRFACMLLAGLALLNAPYYTEADIKAHDAYVETLVRRRNVHRQLFPRLADRAGIGLQKILHRSLHQGLSGLRS